MKLLLLQWSSLGGGTVAPPSSPAVVAWAREMLRIVGQRLKVRGGGEVENE